MDDNLQDFKESMNAWGWSVNARPTMPNSLS